MTPKTIEAINKIPLCIELDVLWSDIMKIIKRDLNNQESELLYIFFSLQKYRFPQTSIDFDSTEILIGKSNMTIAKIKTELEERINSPQEADKILKTFLNSEGVAWEDYLYLDLTIKYLQMMQPLPLGMLNNINHDYTINSIAPSLAEKERIKLTHKSEIKRIESLMNRDENKNKNMEFLYQVKELTEKIRKLESELTFHQPEVNSYAYRVIETIRRLRIVSTDFHDLLDFDKKLTHRLTKECPEYFAALPDKHREKINQKNIKRQSDGTEERFVFCQCQFCYRYRFEKLPRTGVYSWRCDRDECKKRYKAWNKHLNDLRPNPINLSQIYR